MTLFNSFTLHGFPIKDFQWANFFFRTHFYIHQQSALLNNFSDLNQKLKMKYYKLTELTDRHKTRTLVTDCQKLFCCVGLHGALRKFFIQNFRNAINARKSLKEWVT